MAKQKGELPGTLQRSDKHAKRLWKKAHDNAKKTYGEASRANRVAYAALKKQYEKRGDRWVKKQDSGKQ